MKVKREHIAFVGFLALALGVEMVVVQQVVLKDAVADVVVEKWGDESVASELRAAANKEIALPVPNAIGHCVATGGFVLILCCFIVVKQDDD